MFKLWPTLKQYKEWSMPSKLTFISAYIGLFGLFFTVATYFMSDEILKILKKEPERVWLEGRWGGEDDSQNNGYLLEIVDQSKNSFRFNISSNISAHTCDVDGIAILQKHNNAVFNKESDNIHESCQISFKLINKNPLKYKVSSSGCSTYCGMSAFFDNTYSKKDEYFITSGIIDEINISNFYKTVGPNYNLFLSSMELIYEEENLDFGEAQVHSGGVRGIFTFTEGIIMQNANGDIWAAVLDEDPDDKDKIAVKYFSNRADYVTKLPKTIEKWRSRFSEYKVIYLSKDPYFGL